MTVYHRGWGILCLAALSIVLSCRPASESEIETVMLPSPESPLVAFRLLFRVGSIDDPEGKEGLAALTAAMLTEAASEHHTFQERTELLYPMAASIEARVDREVTVIAGLVHRERLEEFTELLTDGLLHPALETSDLERHRQRLLAFLSSTLGADDELLGLEALQETIFENHPYGHPPEGTTQGLLAIDREDVAEFYARHYTRANLTLGLAGGYSDGFLESLTRTLAALPAGTPPKPPLPPPAAVPGTHFVLIQKETDAVGIHLGFVLPLTRADADFYPLLIANSFLGEHRTFHGRLQNELRVERGLNYGSYSYIEYWWDPPGTTTPAPNVPRHTQYFSIWIRPVEPKNDLFALRAALYELDRLVERGMSEEDLELVRQFLVNYSKLWVQTLSDRLGYLMDSRYYGMPDYVGEIERRLPEVTLEEVNGAIRRYLAGNSMNVVVVTPDAAGLAARLENGEASPIAYANPVPELVKAADAEIERLPLRPTSIRIVPADQLFAGASAAPDDGD